MRKGINLTQNASDSLIHKIYLFDGKGEIGQMEI